jgi:hypothetical protein
MHALSTNVTRCCYLVIEQLQSEEDLPLVEVTSHGRIPGGRVRCQPMSLLSALLPSKPQSEGVILPVRGNDSRGTYSRRQYVYVVNQSCCC